MSDGAIITMGMSKYYRYSEDLIFKSVSLIIIRHVIIETHIGAVSSDANKQNKIKVKIYIQLKRYTLLFFLHMDMDME